MRITAAALVTDDGNCRIVDRQVQFRRSLFGVVASLAGELALGLYRHRPARQTMRPVPHFDPCRPDPMSVGDGVMKVLNGLFRLRLLFQLVGLRLDLKYAAAGALLRCFLGLPGRDREDEKYRQKDAKVMESYQWSRVRPKLWAYNL